MTLSLGRVLYRGLLRSGRRIDAQIQRHGTVDVFPEVRPRPPSQFNEARAKPARDLARRRGERRTREPDVPLSPLQTECARLREILPGYKAALALGSRHAVDALIRDAFRDAPSTSPSDVDGALETKTGARLDDAVAAHALLRRRAALLEGMAADTASCVTTEGVRVAVRSALVPEMSSPAESSFVFSYTVSITNLSCDEPVQVVSRHWRIQDEEGRVEEVRGTGVVGFQPILEKGAQFEYTSQAPLRRLKGTMGGSFAVVGQTSGRVMDVPVGAFALGPPRRAAGVDAGETGFSDAKKDEKKPAGKGKGRRVDRSARFTKI